MKYRGDSVCTRCHEDVLSKPHPSTVFEKLVKRKRNPREDLTRRLFGGEEDLGHPLRGKDPKRAGRKFGCVSCHLPHSSDWQYLIRYQVADPSDLCGYCHKKK
jgi:predicted CXXCH cytochrome family protein